MTKRSDGAWMALGCAIQLRHHGSTRECEGKGRALLSSAVSSESTGCMRTLLLFVSVLSLLACGGKSGDSNQGGGGYVASGGANTNAGGATPTSGGANPAAGSAGPSGGTNAAGGAPSTAGTGASAGEPEASGAGGQEAALVDCDPRKVLCKAAQPLCPENQVPSVNGSCYGPCVPLESCACSAAEECPFNDRYTCWQRKHCGPYVR
jgi:hypothetical protein